MFAVGHLALGYISGKVAAKFLNVNINVPMIFLVSILPDMDFLVPGLMHRGPMHSIILYTLIFVPFIMLYKKTGIIYFLCLVQHLLLGDFLTAGCGEGIQLLWPLTSSWYSAGIYLASALSVYLEWTSFLMCLVWMFKSRDLQKLLTHHPSNLALAVPILSIVLPVFFDIPLHAPFALLIPHMIFLSLFSLSVLIDMKTVLKMPSNLFSK